MNMKSLSLSLLVILASQSSVCSQGYDRPTMSGDLRNNSEREEEFKDWALGLFVHWSFDSQLGSVISHSMDYASRDYLDRYVNELPKTFNPTNYDADEWMKMAKLMGASRLLLFARRFSLHV